METLFDQRWLRCVWIVTHTHTALCVSADIQFASEYLQVSAAVQKLQRHTHTHVRGLLACVSTKFMCVFVCSAEVNPEHHVRILEALITAGGLMEVQTAPGRMRS